MNIFVTGLPIFAMGFVIRKQLAGNQHRFDLDNLATSILEAGVRIFYYENLKKIYLCPSDIVRILTFIKRSQRL